MKLTKKTMILRGGTEVFVLTPAELVTNVTSGHDNKGFAAIFGNGSGYTFLTAFFSVASELRRNEILYLNTEFFRDNGFVETFSEIEYKYDIVCTNYCETQLSRKDIEKALTTKAYSEQIVNRSPTTDLHYPDSWKTERRLTVKLHKKIMFISTNKDGFISMAKGSSSMATYGDEYYDFLPHSHFDGYENTSTSVGITLYYWYNRQ